jgi:hypothetical protein
VLALCAGTLSLFRRRLFSSRPAQVHKVIHKDA